MDDRTCSIDGCTRAPIARGWCHRHYMRWYNSDDSGAGTLMTLVNTGECSVEACGKPAQARGWCSAHYSRWLRHGDPLVALRQVSGPQEGPCSVAACDRDAEKRGWCGKHYRRWQRHGDPLAASYEPAPLGGACLHCGSPELKAQSRRYCSERCQMAASRAAKPKPLLATITCEECGDAFTRTTRMGPSRGPRRCPPCSLVFRAWRDREDARRRRARKRGLPVEKYADLEIFERDRWICGLCRMPVDRNIGWPEALMGTIDHIIPLALDGHDIRDNVQLAHLRCNVRKGARLASREEVTPLKEVV